MTKPKKEVTPTLKDFLDKGFAIEKNDGYYGIVDDIEQLLGRDEAQSNEAIEALHTDGKKFGVFEKDTNQPSPSPEELIDEELPAQSLNTILDQVKAIETEDDIKVALAEQLSTMVDLKPNTRRGNFIVYVDGIESDRWTDPKISKSAWVKQIPLVFYWPKRTENVENGNGLTNDGWTVLDKKMARRLKISVHRDDTPNLPYFTVKSHVLCIARKDQYNRKKILQRMKGNMALPQLLAQRQEAAKSAAVLSKTNVDAATQIFSDDMTATKHQVAQTMHAQSSGKMSVQDAQALLENASAESLQMLENQLNNGNVGENTSVVSGQVPDNVI